jgi:phosphoglycolate phosphatase
VKHKTTLIFDFDGTIANTFDVMIDLFNTIISTYDIKPITKELLDIYLDLPLKKRIKAHGVKYRQVPFLVKDALLLHEPFLKKAVPFVGMKEILHALSKKYTLYIASSNKKELIQSFIDSHEMNFFKNVYARTSLFGKDKLLLSLLKKEALSMSEVIYIGDELRDIEACEKIGMDIIPVTYGYDKPSFLKSNYAKALMDSPESLFQYLK